MSGKSSFGIGAIRAAAAKRADATSLRSTAEEIGMSYTAFRHFLKGGDPHPGTREKLAGWYAARVPGPGIPRKDAELAMHLIRQYISAGTTPKIRAKRLAEFVEAISR